MGESFGTGELVSFAFVLGVGQRSGGGRRDIADIYDTDSGSSRGGIERSLLRDARTKIEQALHEEVRAQKSVRNVRFQNVMFNAGVIPLEASGRGSVCAELRKLDDMFDACALGCVNEVALALLDVSRRRHQQEELIDAIQGTSESFGSSEVALNQFNSRKRNGPGTRAVANKSPNRQAPIKKLSR